jgi:hypothetical protein
MTAKEIQFTLMQDRWRTGFCLPNYTPARWWECDVFEVTKAGYFREYEIKISRSDFKADASKATRRWSPYDGKNWTREEIKKHEQIRQPHGPVQFWYVAPEGLLRPEEIPEWAGLITVKAVSWRSTLVENESRPAPRLHRQKIDQKVWEHARGVCYYRLHRELQAKHRQNKKLNSPTD